MASLLDQYYEQIQGLNRQRQMTGNQAFNRGALGEITQGYLDTQYNKEDQRRRTAMAEEAQAFNQANTLQNREDAKSAQTTSLISSAVGGAAQLGTQLYGVNRLTGGQRTPAVNRTANAAGIVGSAANTALTAMPAITEGLTNVGNGLGTYTIASEGLEPIMNVAVDMPTAVADTSFLDDVFSWFGSWF